MFNLVSQTKLDAATKDLKVLEGKIKELTNSKAVFYDRLTETPESFEIIGVVSDIIRDGIVTYFTVGGDVMRVTVNPMADTVTLSPMKRQGEPGIAEVVVELSNKMLDVDFTDVAAAQVYDTYELFEVGPKPSGAEVAKGLNRHVAG